MGQIAAKHGAIAKFSGAGGEDCSVGICFDQKIAESVLAEWKQHGIIPINIGMSVDGIRLEISKKLKDTYSKIFFALLNRVLNYSQISHIRKQDEQCPP